jgi:DNA-binding IclR family transcriptional regulator
MAELDDHAPVRSVARAVDVLLALGRGPMRLGDVSAATTLSKPTTYRLLTTLRSKGMVVQDAVTGEYGLGPACFHLMSSVANGDAGFILEAGPALKILRDKTEETVTVHVRAGLSRICIQEFPSPHAIRYIAGLGATAGIHVGSAGKVLLAFMPEEDRERILLDLHPEAMTENTITDVDALRLELAAVADAGIATSFGERVHGAVGVSAPVVDANGTALAALSVLGPADRLTGPRLDTASELVRRTAEEIGRRIRHSLVTG